MNERETFKMQSPCECGCGRMCSRHYLPGHDAKHVAWAREMVVNGLWSVGQALEQFENKPNLHNKFVQQISRRGWTYDVNWDRWYSPATIAEANLADDILAAGRAKAVHSDQDHWVLYGARRFCEFNGGSATEAARVLARHFLPSGDKARDDRRRANGYTITDNAQVIIDIILRAAS